MPVIFDPPQKPKVKGGRKKSTQRSGRIDDGWSNGASAENVAVGALRPRKKSRSIVKLGKGLLD